MGLPVIGRLADGVTVVSDNGGTRLSMRFELGKEAAAERSFRALHERSMAAVSH